MLKQHVKHYYQWLRSTIHHKTKISQSSPDSLRIQGPSKNLALASCIQSLLSKNDIDRVENVKSLGFYSRLFLVPKPHQRWRPLIDLIRLNTFLLVEKFRMETLESISASLIPGEWIVISRPVRHQPFTCPSTHPQESTYTVLPRFSSVPVHLPFFLPSHDPTRLYNDCKGSKADGPHKGNQTTLIPGQLAYQGPIAGESTSKHSDRGRPNTILRVDNQSREVRIKPTQVFSFMGYNIKYHLDSALEKPTQERWLKLQDLILRLKSKYQRCLMSLIGLLASTEKMVPKGCLHMRPFQWHIEEHWRYPQSLEILLPWSETISAHLEWWQNLANVMKGADLHPKDHNIQIFTNTSNEGSGTYLEQVSTKGLWSDRGKRLNINVLELQGVSLALKRFNYQCQNQIVFVATDNSTIVAYINKQGGTHSAEMRALLWKILTWRHHYQITQRARQIPGCLNVMADLLSRSNQVQYTEWSLHPQVFKQICQMWFTPHIDLFATRLNHKVPLYSSPVPDQHAWDINALNINWLGLTAYTYAPMALLHRVI